MKKLMLAGLLVVSAMSYSSGCVGNECAEPLEGKVDYKVSVYRPLSAEFFDGDGLVDFGCIIAGESKTIDPKNDVEKASLRIEGNRFSWVKVEFDNSPQEKHGVTLTPKVIKKVWKYPVELSGTGVTSGVLLDQAAAGGNGYGRDEIYFGGTVDVDANAPSKTTYFDMTYTLSYK